MRVHAAAERMRDPQKPHNEKPASRPSQGAMQCRECGCLNFNESDYCRDCETKRRQTAAVNGGAAANGRSHVTSEGVLRLTNPIIQSQPRPQAPAASTTNGNGGQRVTGGGVMTPARTRETDHRQHSNGRPTANNGRGPSPPPRTGFVQPGRSFGPAIYGGLHRPNGSTNNTVNIGSTAARVPPAQATGGSRINPPGSSVEPPSRAPPPAANRPRNRPTGNVFIGPQLAESTTATTATTAAALSNKRPRIEPTRRSRDVIDLISSDEEESEASINRREAERVRRQQAISRLALRGVESAEENDAEDVVEDNRKTDTNASDAPVAAPVQEDDSPVRARPFQSRIFDEITFDIGDFPANDVVMNTLRQHRRRRPSSPASSVTTNATVESFDDDPMEPNSPTVDRRPEPFKPAGTDRPLETIVETQSADSASSDPVVAATSASALAVSTPQPQVPRPPSPQRASSRLPQQPDATLQRPAQDPSLKIPTSQPPPSQPPAPQPQATAPQPPANQPPPPEPQPPVAAPQPPPVQSAALQPSSRQLQPTASQAPSAPVITTQPSVPTADTEVVSEAAAVKPTEAVTSTTESSDAPAPKLIVLDDSDDDEDYSPLFQSRIFDSVEFEPLDFSGGEINAGRRSAIPLPPPSPAAVITADEQPAVVRTAPAPVPLPSPDSTRPTAALPPAVTTPMRLVVAKPPAPSISGPTTVETGVVPRATPAPATPAPVVPSSAHQAPPPASSREAAQSTATASKKEDKPANSTASSVVNVLQPRKHVPNHPASRPLQTVTSAPSTPSSQSPIIKREHAAKPKNSAVTKPALGYCSPDMLQFMRESMYDEDDVEDDEELARARLLEVVDLTNSTDESADEDEEEDDEDDYFEIVEQQPASANVRPALGDVMNNTAFPLGAVRGEALSSAGSNPVVIARIKRTRAPRPKEVCVLCEESAWIKALVHCSTCLKYYHKRCAREYGDETVCWNCDLDGMIDDSEVTEDHKKEVVGMFNMLRMSPESDTEAGDEEEKEGDEDLEEKAGGSSPVSLSTLQGQKTRSMKRWKAFLEVATAPVEKGFEETTNQITTELQDEASKVKYSKGFVTKEIVEQAMAEVVDHYANLQDREERAQREERVNSPSTTASASPEIVEPTSLVEGSVAGDAVQTSVTAVDVQGTTTMAPSASTTTVPPASTSEPTPVIPPAPASATSSVAG